MDCYLHIVKDNEPVKDHDLGLHPSEQAPYGYQVKRRRQSVLPHASLPDGAWRGLNRYDIHGVPIGARTFPTTRAAARFCQWRNHNQP